MTGPPDGAGRVPTRRRRGNSVRGPRPDVRSDLVSRGARLCVGSSVVVILAAVWALVLAVAGCGRSSGASSARAQGRSTASAAYTLMQMNLCLSGLAGCYGRVAYPAVLQEAATRIREAHPDAVTFNEACQGDVARIARRTAYYMRFSRVIYRGEPLRCVRPGGRGLFGDAVLSKVAIRRS